MCIYYIDYFFHEMERTWFTIMNCQVEGQNDHDSGQSNRPANKKHGHCYVRAKV